MSEEILRGQFKGKNMIRVGAKDKKMFFDAVLEEEPAPSEKAHMGAGDST